jgi:uncharacterized protein YndB with AHSA1/START domain
MNLYSLSIGRLIQAPIAAVYDAWLNARVLETWMKPKPEVVTSVQSDPTLGGTLRVKMRAAGREEIHDGVYRLIDRPNRLSFSWSSESAGPDTTVNISFLASDGGRTMLLLKHDGLRSRLAQENHREGWRRILDRLAETLERDERDLRLRPEQGR